MSKQVTEKDLLRKAYRDYWQGYREHANSPCLYKNTDYPPVPEALTGLTCGAKTRAGTPCKRIDLYWSGRCKFHGGLSTGPLTESGKAQARENGKLGGRGRVSKPNPLETLRKPQDGALIPGPSGGNTEANPMETVRKQRGPVDLNTPTEAGLRAHVLVGIARKDLETDYPVKEPNPLDSSEKLTFHVEDTGIPALAENLTKPVLLNDQNGNVSVKVQCKNCSNISAGFSCLSPNSGQSVPDLGEWRLCQQFA